MKPNVELVVLEAQEFNVIMNSDTSNVTLVSVTHPTINEHNSPESLMAYCARVSSPNQNNPEYAGLLSYCIKNGHWSVFEMVDMTLEIKTSRAIAAQILRHRSFSFQEFSQRYASVNTSDFVKTEARRQDKQNRQNSINDMPDDTRDWFNKAQDDINQLSTQLYQEALDRGVAKECARFLLPLSTPTRLYMKGSIRSWIHYIELRTDASTQKEHRDIAFAAKQIFCSQFPVAAQALAWNNG